MSEAQLLEHPKNATKVRGKPFQKGHAGGPGRKPGEAIGLTRTLREAVEIAARDCHPQGLAGWLVERAQGGVQDRVIFANMVGKVIPIQVNQQVNGGISINLNWLGGRAIGTVSAQPKVIDAQTVELIQHSEPERWIADANSTQATAPEPVVAAQEPAGYPGTSQPEIVQPAPIQGHGGGVFDSGQPSAPYPPSNPEVGV